MIAGHWSSIRLYFTLFAALPALLLAAAGCEDNAYCYDQCESGSSAGSGGMGGAGGSGDGGLFGTGSGSGGGPGCEADIQSDIENCGSCGNVCMLAGAVPECILGQCVIKECIDGAYDLDGSAATGCEYSCPVPVLGPEACNGLDDDCDGLLDALDPDLSPPGNLCTVTPGTPCESTIVQCNGAMGWSCEYPPEVEVVAGFVRLTETRCDGIDGNCDGGIDEWFVDLGDTCSDSALGSCTDYGIIVCDLINPAKTVCDLSAPPAPGMSSPELCNGLDDNCDGLVDNGLDASAFEMQLIPGSNPAVYVDRFEAARPDATAMGAGILETVACSKAGVIPWTGGSYSEAEAACAARGAGFRLCSAAELEAACRGAMDTLYPYGAAYDGMICNGVDNPAASAMAPVATGSLPMCVVGNPGAFDLSGNVAEWTSSQTNVNPPPDRIFQLHGGSYLSPKLGLACSMDLEARAAEGTLLPNIGFRCCRE